MSGGTRRAPAALRTVAAPATPPGESALCVVRLTGPDAPSIARRATGASLRPRVPTLAPLLDGGELLDRAVVTWFEAPRSPTGEHVVEFTAHGSPYVRDRLLELLLRSGAEPAGPGEFTFRAFLHGKLDLAQAEAVAALIAARSGSAHRAALAALEGGVSERLERLRAGLVDLLARLEASLDHPEEDVPLFDPGEGARAAAALRRDLSAWLERGAPDADSPRVCLTGRPNVGKSSLLNALLGRDRALVSERPGTTRDVLEERLLVSGRALTLVDAAGLREDGEDPVEREGVRRARRALASAELALVVLDGSRALEAGDLRALELAAACPRSLVVLNKSDLPRACEAEGLPVSALTGAGVPELAERLDRALGGSGEGDAPAAGARLRGALRRAEAALAGAERAFPEGEEGAAALLREALEALGEASGEGAPEEVLRAVFSKFCIGK